MQKVSLRGVRVCAALVISLVLPATAVPPPSATLKVAPGYRVRTVFDAGAFKVAGGLALDVNGAAMFCGSGTNIFSWPFPFTNGFVPHATMSQNTDIAAMAAVNGEVFASLGSSFSFPFPHSFARISGGVQSNLFAMDGLYDIAADEAGRMFLVGNPGGAGTVLYSYDAVNGLTTFVTNGGYSGGVAVRSFDGLYFADQNSGAILKFPETNSLAFATNFPGSQLDTNPVVVAENVWGGYLTFDPRDRLLATTGYGNSLAAFDPWSGGQLETVAWDSATNYGIGMISQNLYTREIVVLHTDWSAFRSKIYALRPYWMRGDEDGNHKANLAVVNRSTKAWKIVAPESNAVELASWGPAGAQPLIGDFDGDGIGDLAMRDMGTGKWHVRFSGPTIAIFPPPTIQLPAGSAFSPAPGDYDNDGATEAAVYNRSTGLFTISGYNANPVWNFIPCVPGGVAVSRDYNGDGRDDAAVYVPANGGWFANINGSLQLLGQWGWSAATPAPADYDGDGKFDLAVFYPPTGQWFIKRSSDGAGQAIQFGFNGCVPVPADYDGDGRDDFGLYCPANGMFYASRSTAGFFQRFVGSHLTVVRP